MDVSEKFIKLIPEFYRVILNEDNFEAVVFGVIDRIFSINSGYIFYNNSDEFILKYSYNSALKSDICSLAEFEHLVSELNCLVTDLCIEGVSYAKLVVFVSGKITDKEIRVFESVSAIVSNLVKDLEINAILKMQVDALNEGMEELVLANKRILAAEQNKNEFFANVSHQLRSPLNSIIGFADILNSEFVGKLNDKQKDYISDIKISGIKLLEMVNEVLDISKLESNAMKLFKQRFNIQQNIQEVLNILKPLYMQKGIIVKNDVSVDVEMFGDYQKLQQVFFNIVSNAVKFSNIGGEIRISSCIINNQVQISVKDNGIGIDKKFHKKIFKKFQQISAQDSSSTGLGLTIADKITRLHRGKILLDSELGQGAKFTVCLPLC